MFERQQRYEAFWLPGSHELPIDEAVRMGLSWLYSQPGTPLIALHAKRMVSNNRRLQEGSPATE